MESPDNTPQGALTQIGKYEVVGVLGRGGMGVVYRGLDRRLRREVAIKTLTEGIQNDSEMLSRFYDEGRKTASFKHPNIVTIFELGDDNGIPYIVMELVDGNPLDKLLTSDQPIPIVDRLKIVEELCSALAYAHRSNVIHRDVKPANIYVQPDGHVKLLDFGIARLEARKSQDLSITRPGHIIGTLPYMAPERLRDKPLDRRSDIFAAGVVLYQLLAGELPFAGEELELMQHILSDPHPPLSSKCKGIPSSLEAIVDRALAKSPDDRYPVADEMAADLTTAIAEIKQEMARRLYPEARRYFEAGDLLRAREHLQQLLAIQTRHQEARDLLAEIQRQLSLRLRSERVLQLRQQAEGLLANREYERSLALLDEGLELEAENQDLIKLRQRVEKEKQKQERIREFLRQADTARREGDYPAAIAAAKKALKVDKLNSKGMMLVNLLVKEAERAEKQAEMRALLQSARGEITAGRYMDAMGFLHKAELVDPTNPELQLLLGDVNSGLDQIMRRATIAQLENDLIAATTFDELQRVQQAVRDALTQMPAESALIRMNAQLDREVRNQENRKFVDDNVQACRDLRPREALELVQNARKRFPEEERLLTLEKILIDRISRQSVDERREEYMAHAREALKHEKYADAVLILEGCRREGITNDEINSLLEFARHEDTEHQRQHLLRSRIEQAHSLIKDSAFEDAIRFLEDSLQQNDDAALRLLLEQAIAGRASLQVQIDTALRTAAAMTQEGDRGQAIEFLQAQPASFRRSLRMKIAEAALKEEQQQAIFRTMGRAYATLESDLSASNLGLRRATAAMADPAVSRSMTEAFNARKRAVADRALSGLIARCKTMLRSRDKTGLSSLIAQASPGIDFASPETKSEWQSILAEATKTGPVTRSRK
jgi:eukaryotic-like serine/threonine-protein kinase